jgi:hypothetical protein
MTFLACDAQKNYFLMQKSQTQFELSLVGNRARMLSKNMDNYSAANEGANLDRDPYYQSLAREEEFLATRQDNLESQIALLDAQVSGLKTLVNNNIKNSCGLNLLGG